MVVLNGPADAPMPKATLLWDRGCLAQREGSVAAGANGIFSSKNQKGEGAKDDLVIGGDDLAEVLDFSVEARVHAANEGIDLAEIERRAVMHALQEAGGNKVAASRFLRIGRTTLYRKLRGLNGSSQDHPDTEV